MYTGYDNFWLFQNNRQGPVVNLPKNDNQSHAVLTDSYKQMQNGGHPSVLNSCIPPNNNIPRSQANEEQRMSHSQYMCSVYPAPLRPSYGSNFHPQVGFSVHSNNSQYAPHYTQANYTQGQQNLSDRNDLRNFKNSNTSVSQVQNRDNQNNNSALVRDIQNSNPQTSRIRVRDVYSLNKTSDLNQELRASAFQKEQLGYYPYNSTYSTENQSQFVNYGRGSLPQANHLPPYYRTHQMPNHHPTAAGSTQQFHQNSSSFYQQNSASQHQFLTNSPMDRNLNFNASKPNTQNVPTPEKLLPPRTNQEPCLQNGRRISSESVGGIEVAKVIPERNSVLKFSSSVRTTNPTTRDSLDVSNRLICEKSNLGNIPQIQKQKDDACSFRNSSSTSASNGTAIANIKSPIFQNSGGQETVIKISIPHSGQNTFITLNDSDSTKKNSSLPCLLEWDPNNINNNNAMKNNVVINNNNNINKNNNNNINKNNNNNINKNNNNNKAIKNNVVNVPLPQGHKTSFSNLETLSSISPTSANTAQNCPNSESGSRKTLTVPPRKRFCPVRKPFMDLNNENLKKNEFLNSAIPDNSISRVTPLGESIASETIFQENITVNALELKQENFISTIQSSARDVKVSEKKKVTFEIIKKEETPIHETAAVQEDEAEPVDEYSPSEVESVVSEIEFTENVDVKGFSFVSETLEPVVEAVNDSENLTEEAFTLNSTNDKSKDTSTDNNWGAQEKCFTSEKTYKSRINRNKLDMLIQFLEMDEEPVDNKQKYDGDRESKKEIHSRRKLSKNCIIKNKKNQTEILKYNKNRAEVPKCSPPAPLTREGRHSVEDKLKTDESDIASEINMKSNPPRLTKTEGENSCEKSDPKNTSESSTVVSLETSEESSSKPNCSSQNVENIINRIRALPYVETIFCRNCDLFESRDSFWINIASGELKCFNCFKNIPLKSKKSDCRSNTACCTDGKTVQKVKAEREIENTRESTLERNSDNKLKDTKRIKRSSELDFTADMITINTMEAITQESIKSIEIPIRARKETTVEEIWKANNPKEERQIQHSEDKSKGEMKTGRSKRKESVSKENCGVLKSMKEGSDLWKATTSVETQKKDQPKDQSSRKHNSKDNHDTHKKPDTVGTRTLKGEETGEHAKRDKKSTEASNQIRKRRDSKDFGSCKSPEEHSDKEAKTDSANKSPKKSSECYHSLKDNNADHTTKKSTKLEHSEKTKAQSPARENNTGHKAKESDSSGEFKAKNTCNVNNSEKHKRTESTEQSRKRKNSDEDAGPVKVRVVEDQTKKDVKPVQHKASTSKEDTKSRETEVLDNEIQSMRNSVQKSKRNSVSKEEGEYVSKEKEDRHTYQEMYHKIKTHEANHKASEPTETVRKKSKEQGIDKRKKSEVRQEKSDKRKCKDIASLFGEPHTHGIAITENKVRKKTEEREKNHFDRKSDKASRLLKENQNTEERSDKNKDISERKKNSKDKKDSKREKETSEKNARKEVDSTSGKKKYSGRSEGKCDNIQTENRRRKAAETVAERFLGDKTEDEAPTKAQSKRSATLLSKLIKKTKKLSRSLLNDA